MRKFKVGDRVKYIGKARDAHLDPIRGVVGVIVRQTFYNVIDFGVPMHDNSDGLWYFKDGVLELYDNQVTLFKRSKK